MAVLFNKEKNRYIELSLFALNDPEWITYKMCGGKICRQKEIELFRLDNDDLFFHNSYEKEVDDVINGLRNIKKSCSYRFQPKDEREFVLKAIYKDNMVYIKFLFNIIDEIKKEELQDNTFEIKTTYPILCDFLTQLKKEYEIVVGVYLQSEK